MEYTAIAKLMPMTPAALPAVQKPSEIVTFSETATVNGAPVPPEDYRVERRRIDAPVSAIEG